MTTTFKLLHCNDQFVVINKAEGQSVHRDENESGLVMTLQAELQMPELRPVHRLDKVTSGIMLLARSAEVAAEMERQFRSKRVEKYYLALSDHAPSKKQGTIKGDMVRSRRATWKLSSSMKNPAVTQFFSTSLKPGVRAFIIKPLTGKTHQIRVALKSLGSPILGDSNYAAKQSDRVYLHAYQISFTLFGDEFTFRCWPERGEHFDAQFKACIEDKFNEPSGLAWPSYKIGSGDER